MKLPVFPQITVPQAVVDQKIVICLVEAIISVVFCC